MRKLLLAAGFFLMMIHSEAQPLQKEIQIEKAPALSAPNTLKNQYLPKVSPYNLASLRRKVHRWKNTLSTSAKPSGIAALKRSVPVTKQPVLPPVSLFQGDYLQTKQLVYKRPVPAAVAPVLTLPAIDDNSGINVTLSPKASLSLDFGADDDDTDSLSAMDDNSPQDIDISLGFMLAIK